MFYDPSYYKSYVYYSEYDIKNADSLDKKLEMLAFNIAKAESEIQELKGDLFNKINDWQVDEKVYNVLEYMKLDELYNIIYRKIFQAADEKAKAEYHTLYKLLNEDSMKTVIAIQMGLTSIIKGEINYGTR